MIFLMFFAGFFTGSRAMTPIAALCWCAWLTEMHLENTWASWASHPVSALLFTALALGEYAGDVHPKTPSRKSFIPAVSRLIFGGLCGAIIAASFGEPIAGGILFGAAGAAIGTWGFFGIRQYLAVKCGQDRTAGLIESAVTAVGSGVLSWRVHSEAIYLWSVRATKFHH